MAGTVPGYLFVRLVLMVAENSVILHALLTSIENTLLDRMLPSVPELPRLNLVFWALLFSEHQHYHALRDKTSRKHRKYFIKRDTVRADEWFPLTRLLLSFSSFFQQRIKQLFRRYILLTPAMPVALLQVRIMHTFFFFQ